MERCTSMPDGVERLMAWLERRCSRQPVPDVGQELEAFLNKLKRRRLEPMQQWTDRLRNHDPQFRRALARALGQSAPVPNSSSKTWMPSRPWKGIDPDDDPEARDWPSEPAWAWEYTGGQGDAGAEDAHRWSAADPDVDSDGGAW